MFKLVRFLKGYGLQSVLGPIFKFTEAVFELIVPLVMAQIIDVGIKNGDKAYVLKMGGVLVILAFVGYACALTAQYFAAKASVGFGTALRNGFYKHINTLSFSEIDKIGTPSLITRMTSDINQAQTGVNQFLRLFLRTPFIVIGSVLMSFLIDKKLTLIFLLSTALISVAIFIIMRYTLPLYKKIQKKLDKVSQITRENLSGVRVIRAFSKSENEIERFNETTNDLRDSSLLVGKISALLNPVTYVIVNLCIILILWFGGKTVNVGRITQGEVVALINYMSQSLLALIVLADLIIYLTKASASASRINEIFDIKTSLTDEENEDVVENKTDIKVEFKDVSFAYNGTDELSVEKLSFFAKRGETIGIIGGTGSGKSTVINLISRFYDVTKGEILVDGVNVKDYKLDVLRDKIALVPQKTVLFSGNIRDNMKWGNPDITDEEIYKALEIAQAKDFIVEKGKGLDLEVLRGGKNFSGGQRQRLTIARAIASNPEILILDDSSSALDFATDAKLRKSLLKMQEENPELTVFLVSQRATSIKHADWIIVMDDGVAVGIGKHDELFNNCEVYREICLSQISEEESRR